MAAIHEQVKIFERKLGIKLSVEFQDYCGNDTCIIHSKNGSCFLRVNDSIEIGRVGAVGSSEYNSKLYSMINDLLY